MFKHGSVRRSGAKIITMSTSTLDQAVDLAEETYRTFRVKLESLISTLKSHHEVMLKMNNSQMQVRHDALYDCWYHLISIGMHVVYNIIDRPQQRSATY